MISFKLDNIHKFTKFPENQNVIIKHPQNNNNHGLAFDTILGDFIINFAYDVGIGVISGYLVEVLTSQKDSGGTRNIYIENQQINVNAISEEEIKKIVDKVVEEKLKNINDE